MNPIGIVYMDHNECATPEEGGFVLNPRSDGWSHSTL